MRVGAQKKTNYLSFCRQLFFGLTIFFIWTGCAKKTGLDEQGRCRLDYWNPDKKGNRPAHLAFQKAIDFISDQGGGTLMIAKGKYLIPGTEGKRILCKSKVNLYFEPGCVLYTGFQNSNAWVIDINTLYADCQNIRIDGNGLLIEGDRSMKQIGMGIVFNKHKPSHRLDHVVISDITLRNFSNTGVNIGGGEGILASLNQSVSLKQSESEITISVNNPGSFDSFAQTPKLVEIGSYFFTVVETAKGRVRLRIHEAKPLTSALIRLPAGSPVSANGYPEELYFDGLVCDDNKVNGLSITHGNQIHFKHCTFSNTEGAGDPEAGVDIEPNAGQSVFNVSFDDCSFLNNRQNGLYIQKGLGVVSEQGKISNCRFEGNGEHGCAISQKGWTVSNCRAINNKMDGFFLTAGDTVLDSCEAIGNGDAGFAVVGGRSEIIHSAASNNKGAGFELSSLEGGTLSHSISRNNHFGIAANQVSNLEVSNNIITENLQDGIRISDQSERNRFIRNKSYDNGRDQHNGFADISIESGSSYNEFSENELSENALESELQNQRLISGAPIKANKNLDIFIQSDRCRGNIFNDQKKPLRRISDKGKGTIWKNEKGE